MIPSCVFYSLILNNELELLFSLFCQCLAKKQVEKAEFVKKILREHLLNQEESFFGGDNKEIFELFKLSEENLLFLKEDFSFFMEICNSKFRNIFLEANHWKCLKYLYYAEGRGFKQFLLWSYLNNYKLKLSQFTEYIAKQRKNPSNFAALLIYLKKKIRKTELNYCIYVHILKFP